MSSHPAPNASSLDLRPSKAQPLNPNACVVQVQEGEACGRPARAWVQGEPRCPEHDPGPSVSHA